MMLMSSTADPGVAALHQTAATAGFVAFALMVGTMTFGLLTTTGLARRSVRRQTLYGGHMAMAIATVAFVAVHALANVLRPSPVVTPTQALVPFALGGPAGVAFGTLATELAITLAVSVWAQRRLTYRRWHHLHWLAYPAFALATLHTFVSGSDVHGQLVVTTLIASVLAVVALLVLRALPPTSIVRTRAGTIEP
jgi:sulfoxide reductase heme-binding subunit YedZ